MEAIMQGTTPTLTITINQYDFLLSTITKMELYVQNGNNVTTYTEADLIVDTEANTVTRHFTETETAAMDPKKVVKVQGRFWVGDSVIGINKLTFGVSDMLGVGPNG